MRNTICVPHFFSLSLFSGEERESIDIETLKMSVISGGNWRFLFVSLKLVTVNERAWVGVLKCRNQSHKSEDECRVHIVNLLV